MGKIWKYKNNVSDIESIKKFAQNSGIPPLLALLMKNRGINTPEEAKRFMKKSLEGIHNPAYLPDIENACERIISALENKEKITVYGDYDADGVTATAILVKFLKAHGGVVEYYIPNRENEGYGINVMALNRISKNKTKLLITVDCGITSYGEVELAKTLGMDVIITDHHLCKEKIPKAIAVINPKREDSEYPFSALAGAGVAFKLVLALAKAMGEKTSDCFFEYVDIASIGTIADVVSLLDENRVIAQKGLEVIKASKNVGIKALFDVANTSKRPINATAVSFMLAPRINAGGRMESADKAVELLLSKDYDEAYKIAEELDRYNTDRRNIEREIFDEALKMIDNDENFSEKSAIVLGSKNWHPGVIGIVASKITEKFMRPTILVAFDERGNGKGSARSVEGFDMFSALMECKEFLSNFGGHSMAAGISVVGADMEAFSDKFNSVAKERIAEEDKFAKIYIDCELAPSMVNLKNAEILEYMEPYGEGNPKPIFSISNAKISKIEQIGADFAHLRLVLEKNGFTLNAVGFFMGEYKNIKKEGDNADIAFTMEVNEFRGEKRVELMLKDIK